MRCERLGIFRCDGIIWLGCIVVYVQHWPGLGTPDLEEMGYVFGEILGWILGPMLLDPRRVHAGYQSRARWEARLFLLTLYLQVVVVVDGAELDGVELEERGRKGKDVTRLWSRASGVIFMTFLLEFVCMAST